jgi:hypothetical protein
MVTGITMWDFNDNLKHFVKSNLDLKYGGQLYLPQNVSSSIFAGVLST